MCQTVMYLVWLTPVRLSVPYISIILLFFTADFGQLSHANVTQCKYLHGLKFIKVIGMKITLKEGFKYMHCFV